MECSFIYKPKPSASHSTAQGGRKTPFSWCKLMELEFKGIGTIYAS